MKLVEKRIVIDAPASVVYTLLTQAEMFVEWMAPTARIDARANGQITWTHHNGDTVTGAFVELVENRRIVFTFGWERTEVGVAPGSTTVEIDLRPHPGGTELRLIHRGLEGPMADAHAGGWDNYLERLAVRATGRDPGPDPLEHERVPAHHELGLREH
jgi:uncharacterized protein YndB with AHSA1/START domain